jgi:hypothetical protein
VFVGDLGQRHQPRPGSTCQHNAFYIHVRSFPKAGIARNLKKINHDFTDIAGNMTVLNYSISVLPVTSVVIFLFSIAVSYV